MSESESSAELVDELVMESIKEDEAGKSPRWHRQVALSSLVLALLAALTGLLAGLTASQELHIRTQEIMEVTLRENERVNVQVLKAKHELLEELGRTVDPDELAQVQAFEKEIETLAAELVAEERQDERTGNAHLILAIAVLLLSVGITLSGMAIVVEEKLLWYAGLVVGAAGIVGLVLGIVQMLA